MRTEAHGLVQVRYFDGSEKLRQKESDYAKNVIYMTSFTTAEFSALLAETGFVLFWVRCGTSTTRRTATSTTSSGSREKKCLSALVS